MNNVIHVEPRNDLIEHTDGFGTCACGPEVQAVRAGVGDTTQHIGWLVVHHSLDGREREEV